MMINTITPNLHLETWSFTRPFRIAGHCYKDKTHIVLSLSDGTHTGRGEACCVRYCGETPEQVYADIHAIRKQLRAGLSREQLQSLLPAGGARNAVDLALWDLECKQQNKSIWELTGINPKPIDTVYTIGIEDTPEQMAAQARDLLEFPLFKVKLDSDRPLERIQAIHSARPDARLVIDANQGWDLPLLQSIAPKLKDLNVEMIEQPLPRGQDEALADYQCPIMLAADESCLERSELAAMEGRYQMINIKLDKTGGLTEALLLAKEARQKGFKLMVGGMGGTSLSTAPAFVLGQLCELRDMDGPLLLNYDREHAIRYVHEMLDIPSRELWG